MKNLHSKVLVFGKTGCKNEHSIQAWNVVQNWAKGPDCEQGREVGVGVSKAKGLVDPGDHSQLTSSSGHQPKPISLMTPRDTIH